MHVKPEVAGSSPAWDVFVPVAQLVERRNQTKKAVPNVTMAEWSKAVDLRPTIFGCAGSNPAGDTLLPWPSG